jgi:hypothetical protein
VFARKYDCDLDDLLDWFTDPMGMQDLTRWTLPQVPQSVKFK